MGDLEVTWQYPLSEFRSEQARASLVPRPSPAPVFDRLQYAKTEGEGPEEVGHG